MSEVNLSKLKKLFQEKKYSEIVMDIELKTTEMIGPQHYIIC